MGNPCVLDLPQHSSLSPTRFGGGQQLLAGAGPATLHGRSEAIIRGLYRAQAPVNQ